MSKYNFEERLVDFAVIAIKIARQLPKTFEGQHLGSQLIRSGSSPALNYGEAQSAESRKDFILKLKIVLKELRESKVCLKIITRAELLKNNEFVDKGLKECDELIAIFAKSDRTARTNQERK